MDSPTDQQVVGIDVEITREDRHSELYVTVRRLNHMGELVSSEDKVVPNLRAMLGAIAKEVAHYRDKIDYLSVTFEG